jgi:hypothetical protein
MVGGVYKIVAKVLARLKMVLERIISNIHNASIRGRQILGYVLIANECLDSMIRYEGAMQIGHQKPYDHVN